MLGIALGIALLAGHSLASLGGLDAFLKVRQVNPGDIGAPECFATCNAATQIQMCVPKPDCFCTEDFNKQVTACYNCVLSSGGNTTLEAQSLQMALAELEDGCKQVDHPLSSLTVDGGFTPSPVSAAEGGSAAATTPPTLTPTPDGSVSSTSLAPESLSSTPTSSSPISSAGAASGDAMTELNVGPSVVLIGVLGGALVLMDGFINWG